MDAEGSSARGVSGLWTSVNHIALVVSDVGRSLTFYSDVVGMKQVLRPNFDRHGAWLTFGNVDLHLIKGRPAVHADDDLIVSHIAITVNDMSVLKARLKQLNVPSRKNVSVPNPADSDTGIVEQAFVRDPDGYYIEFCNCQLLEEYLHAKMAEEAGKWNVVSTISAFHVGNKLKMIADSSKKNVGQFDVTYPDDLNLAVESSGVSCDTNKLENLIKRKKVYGDITQNATKDELCKLLIYFDNQVPKVISALEHKVHVKGSRTFVPPAFFGRDGTLYQPPSFEMAALASTENTTENQGRQIQ